MIISVSNQKGGVGKTTSVFALGTGLASQGARVLLIDLDPQASLTISTALEPDDLQVTIYDALVKRKSPPVVNLRERLDLIPTNIDLSAAEMELVNEMGRERLLSELLAPLSPRYDFILIDSPPSLGLLTINALTAADAVLIPVNCEYLAMRGLQLLLNTITKVQSRLNPSLRVLGILPTMFDSRTLHAKEVVGELKGRFSDQFPIFNPVRRSVRFAEAPIVGQSVLDYAEETEGATVYLALAKEIYSEEAR